MARHNGISVEHSHLITATPSCVLDAFFDSRALATWWHTTQSVTVPEPLGVYAVEWEPTVYHDELLGQLGGSFHGTVMEYRPGFEFFVADAYWLPPQGNPLGPMALEVTCTIEGPATRVTVRQSGRENGTRWKKYFSLIDRGWLSALQALSTYIEKSSVLDTAYGDPYIASPESKKKKMQRISKPKSAVAKSRRKKKSS